MVNRPTNPSRQNTASSVDIAVEAELKSCLQQQSSVFENAVALIERLESAAGRRELGNPDSVAQLQKSLEQVVSAQQKVSTVQNRLTQPKASLSHDVRQSLARHEALLRNLINRIDQLQETFKAIQTELMPQLDFDTRRRNMQAAYQQSLKSV